MDMKNWKLLGAGITVAVLTSCGDGKEKTQQDNEPKAKTEQIMTSQKIISELLSDGISVLKSGEKGKPDSLLHSVEKEGNVYSNPEYKATDDVSKALGIEISACDVIEVKINREDATKVLGSSMGFGIASLKVGDILKVGGDGGYQVKIIDDNARKSMTLKINYDYKDVNKDLIAEHEFQTDDVHEGISSKYKLIYGPSHVIKSFYKDEKFGYLPRETVSTGDWNSVVKEGKFVEIPLEVLDNKLVVFIKGKKYDFDFGDLSKANIVRDTKLPEKPKAPKRKIGEALIHRTLAEVKKNKR